MCKQSDEMIYLRSWNEDNHLSRKFKHVLFLLLEILFLWDSSHSWISGSLAIVTVPLFALWTLASPGQRNTFYISIAWCRQNESDAFMNVPKNVDTCTINLICLAYCTLGIHLHNACMHISAWEIMGSSMATLHRKSSLKAMLSSQCLIH